MTHLSVAAVLSTLLSTLLVVAPAASGTSVGSGGDGAPPSPLRCGHGVVRGVVTLTHDLWCEDAPEEQYEECGWDSCPEVHGLALGGATVLDLGGHTLHGPGTGRGQGLLLPENGDVVIRNGTITGWAVGGRSPEWGSTGSATFEDVTFVDNGTDVVFFGDRLDVDRSVLRGGRVGVLCVFGSRCALTGTTVVDVHTGVSCSDSDCEVARSRFRGNGTAMDHDGSGRTTVHDSDVRGSGTGFHAEGTSGHHELRRTLWADNGTAVELVSAGATVTANVLQGNDVAVSTADRLPWSPARDHRLVGNVVVRNGDGIVSTSTHLTYRRNVVTDNRGRGVDAARATDGGGNVVLRNGRGS